MDAKTKKEIVGTTFSHSPADHALGFSLGLTMMDMGKDVGMGLFFRGALLTTDRGISKDMLARQPVWAEHVGAAKFSRRISPAAICRDILSERRLVLEKRDALSVLDFPARHDRARRVSYRRSCARSAIAR